MTHSSPHIQLLLIVWLAIWMLLLCLDATLFVWYVWPTLRRAHHSVRTACYRRLHCPWCWRAFRLMRWYPRRWSSTMCSHHKRQLRTQLAARHARNGTAIKPIAPARQAKEVQA